MNFHKLTRAVLSITVTLILASGASGALAEDPSVMALRKRIDKSELFCASNPPAALVGHRPRGKKQFDVDGLLRALDQSGGVPDAVWVRRSLISGDEVADTNGRSLVINRRSGLVRMRDARGYKSASKGKAEDADLITRAKVVLASLGAGPDDSTYDVQTLVARRQDANSNTEVVEELARKVIVSRRIGGIPVEGERVVLSFTLDGELRKVLGHWHQLDFDNSQFDTSLTDVDVTDSALGRIEHEMANTRVSISDQGNAKVRTVFVPVDVDDGQFVLVPGGRVDVPTAGPGGTVTTVLDFNM